MNPFRLHKKGYLREAFPKKKVLKEYPFGIGDETEDPSEVSEAVSSDKDDPFKKDPKAAKDSDDDDGSDVALKLQAIQQKKEDEAQAAREQEAAANKAEQERIGQIRSEADQAVADDLNGKYSDKPDKVEFWPTLESFARFCKEDDDEENDKRTVAKMRTANRL